jgi:tetratricopeptide (TPR) repeat protein
VLINPNLAAAWSFMGWVKVWLGESGQAVERFSHGMRLGPIESFTYFMQEGMAHAHFFAGRYDEALSWAKIALRELPDNHPALRIAAASCALAGLTKKRRD